MPPVEPPDLIIYSATAFPTSLTGLPYTGYILCFLGFTGSTVLLHDSNSMKATVKHTTREIVIANFSNVDFFIKGDLLVKELCSVIFFLLRPPLLHQHIRKGFYLFFGVALLLSGGADMYYFQRVAHKFRSSVSPRR